ncbi:MAG: GntR family transcriptional regulator [Oscillospiraceae bacterium]|nr:GntR family transcriptional regulator [Oscillospiraceae bacterium]
MTKTVPKYIEIADWLRQNIQDGTFKTGERLITEHSLCEKFNISRHTARSAIAVLEKEDLVVRRQGDGTYINLDVGAKQKNIGLLLTDSSCYTFPNTISGVEEVLSAKGHRITLALSQNKVEIERNQLLSLQAANIDGLIVEAVKSALASPNLDIYKDFAAQNIPVVFVNTYYPRLDCNYIINDDVEASRIATGHLINQGHQKIGGIFKLDSIQGALRYEGFVNKLYGQNLKLDEHRVLWYSDETLDYLFSNEQFPLLSEALSDCTAVLCYSDRVALKLIEASPKLGLRIPHDLSIASFDDSILSRLATPSITSVTHPGPEMGNLAATSLLKMIEIPSHKMQHAYTPTLTIRDSVRDLS